MSLGLYVPREPKVDDDGTGLAPAATRGIGCAVEDVARLDVVVDDAMVDKVGQGAGDIGKNVTSVVETTFEVLRSWPGRKTPVRRGEVVRISVFDDQGQKAGVEGGEVGNVRLFDLVSGS